MSTINRSDRPVPHSLEAERSILGAILIDNEALNVAAAVIDARSFFRDAHRRIFETMVVLAERSQPIDLVTLKEALGRVGEVSETSDAVLFLARAGFVTGLTLDLDGGYSHVR